MGPGVNRATRKTGCVDDAVSTDLELAGAERLHDSTTAAATVASSNVVVARGTCLVMTIACAASFGGWQNQMVAVGDKRSLTTRTNFSEVLQPLLTGLVPDRVGRDCRWHRGVPARLGQRFRPSALFR